ncbi:uncharacterized protein LOC108673455 [Hyalella azteca]|uniref:Uncharacterized protein LOC108673455 n=1 Tax=Hyalella azteca TaxID=294128 RepID=A0A8B7NSU4_HYAAZ|nr:uncharacterized protein LOC108673455 [Hyalella azteca]
MEKTGNSLKLLKASLMSSDPCYESISCEQENLQSNEMQANDLSNFSYSLKLIKACEHAVTNGIKRKKYYLNDEVISCKPFYPSPLSLKRLAYPYSCELLHMTRMVLEKEPNLVKENKKKLRKQASIKALLKSLSVSLKCSTNEVICNSNMNSYPMKDKLQQLVDNLPTNNDFNKSFPDDECKGSLHELLSTLGEEDIHSCALENFFYSSLLVRASELHCLQRMKHSISTGQKQRHSSSLNSDILQVIPVESTQKSDRIDESFLQESKPQIMPPNLTIRASGDVGKLNHVSDSSVTFWEPFTASSNAEQRINAESSESKNLRKCKKLRSKALCKPSLCVTQKLPKPDYPSSFLETKEPATNFQMLESHEYSDNKTYQPSDCTTHNKSVHYTESLRENHSKSGYSKFTRIPELIPFSQETLGGLAARTSKVKSSPIAGVAASEDTLTEDLPVPHLSMAGLWCRLNIGPLHHDGGQQLDCKSSSASVDSQLQCYLCDVPFNSSSDLQHHILLCHTACGLHGRVRD